MPRSESYYNKRHNAHLNAVQQQIDRLFKQAAKEAAAIAARLTPGDTTEHPFTFDNYPEARRQVENLMSDLRRNMQAVVVNGVADAWSMANNKADDLFAAVFGKSSQAVATTAQGMAMLNRRLDALQAFQERQTAGLNLSDRVWKYTDCFKQEIELGLSAGIEPGQPAADIARSLTQYLQHPDKLFRRVRDQYGNLQLSKAAAAFHPGRGVYRSSYKNARRLAATETNMAYRTADHQRWKAAPYVVGIHISLSHNHTCLDRNGVPQDFTDICDELAGDYPKTFHFTGWHPHCRCTATAILKTQDEIDEDTRRILNGEDPTDPDTSDNHIPHLPKNFTDWQERNAARIASSPNPPAWATAKDQTQPATPRKTPQEIAAERHAARTQEQADDIKRRYWVRWEPDHLTQAEKEANVNAYLEIEKALGVKRGRPMNFEQANQLRANPNYAKGGGYKINCQTCVVANELRRRGFPVEALANTKGSALEKLSHHTESAWINATKTRVFAKRISYNYVLGYKIPFSADKRNSFVVLMDNLNNTMDTLCKDNGTRCHLNWGWNTRRTGHIITAERVNGVMKYYDPQTGYKEIEMNRYLKGLIDLKCGIDVLRVDNLTPVANVVGKVLTKEGAKAASSKAGKVAGVGSIYDRQKDAEKSDRFRIKDKQELGNIRTRNLCYSSNSRSYLIRHAKTKNALEAAEYAWNNPQELRFKRVSELGEGKDLTNPEELANVNAKRRRGVKRYNIYEITYNGRTWEIGMEEYKTKTERFYFIK